jgi:predicted transcriptional regulator
LIPDISNRLLDLIERRPGMTELEMARELFGVNAVQQSVNSDCRLLVSLGLVERIDVGGSGDPYTYRTTEKLRALRG